MFSARLGLVLFAGMIVSSTGCLTQPELDNDELGRVIYTIPAHPGDGRAHAPAAPVVPAQHGANGANAPEGPENGKAPADSATEDAFPPNKPAEQPKPAEPPNGEAAKGKPPTGDSASEKAAKEDAGNNGTKKPAR